MKRWAGIVGFFLCVLLNLMPRAGAQDAGMLHLPPKPVVTSPRIYVLDCGAIANSSMARFQMTVEDVKNPNMIVMCFLVVHPKGTLIWDTGLTDRWVGRPFGEIAPNKNITLMKTKSLIGQLADIGYTPEMIDYISLSHHHFDHSGNANAFAKTATWLVAKPEWDVMFGSKERPQGYDDFALLKDAKTVFVGDTHDVFGDGSVIIRRAAGHTPGHSVLQVNLKNTGPVILAGDLYHFPEEITLGRMPKREETTGTKEARAKVLDLAKTLKAQVWIAHDTEWFLRATRAPGYYD